MCPFFVVSIRQDLCNCHLNGLYCPSLQMRNEYCFLNYINCKHYQKRSVPSHDFSANLDDPKSANK